MDAKEEVVRALYAARAAGDWARVRSLLADDVRWHEPGDEDWSGSHAGGDGVTATLRKLSEVTAGTFRLEPTDVFSTAEHVAARVEWSAERGGSHASGYEVAVFRVAGDRVAEAWFYPDGFDPRAMSDVFAFEG